MEWTGDWTGFWTGLLDYWTGLLDWTTTLRMREISIRLVLSYMLSERGLLAVSTVIAMFTGTRDDPIVLEETPPSSSKSLYPWLKVESSPVKVLPGKEYR